MSSRVSPLKIPRGVLDWGRVRFTLIASATVGLLLALPNETAAYVVVFRALVVGLAAMFAFGTLESWPVREPQRVPRWVVQLVGMVVVVPFAAWLAYWLTTGGDPQLAEQEKRMVGYLMLTFAGMFFAPWIALAAMLRQREAFARTQALAFDLERSELQRQALNARLRLLQAQVEPHFLFNTLANVQALVESGSPQASAVLHSLIAYLRAAVPRLGDAATSLGQEVELVRAYLEVMQMRMPDRLAFEVQVDVATHGLQCPPMTLLTLVENAVRHGIDPSEEGGRIDVQVRLVNGRCHLSVSDTGVGLKAVGSGLGTGLSTLRERLRLAFGDEATLRLNEVSPSGVCAEVEFPAREARP
jgi:LytS/YehU family sensor histidine kinase